jgi:hypothetical protein
MAAKDQTQTTHQDAGLLARCFVIWGTDRRWQCQGIVRERLDEEHYLIQYFDDLTGEPSTMAVFSIRDMSGKPNRSEGAWEFFEDAEHLRHWCQSVYDGDGQEAE